MCSLTDAAGLCVGVCGYPESVGFTSKYMQGRTDGSLSSLRQTCYWKGCVFMYPSVRVYVYPSKKVREQIQNHAHLRNNTTYISYILHALKFILFPMNMRKITDNQA